MNSLIDHTCLKPDATEDDIKKLCKEANEHKFASVCIAPYWIGKAHAWLKKESGVKFCTVIGFPHGNIEFGYKAHLIKSLSPAVDEFDVVLNVGGYKSKNCKVESLAYEIPYCKEAAGDKVVKFIVEVGYLNDKELFELADCLIRYKVDFIKTCTGYGPRGVTVEDIVKIKKHVGDKIKIKASGGIKGYEFAKSLVDAGADRIGCSASVNIVKESQLLYERKES